MRKIVVFIMIVVFVMMPCLGFCETIDWKKYDEGITLAQKQNKKIFLHFRTDWCRYCDEMDRSTFKDNSVIQFLNEHFVCVKVDGDKEKSIVKEYKVQGYPDSRFLNENSKEVHRLPGFIELSAFKFFLEYIQTDNYLTMDPMQYYRIR